MKNYFNFMIIIYFIFSLMKIDNNNSQQLIYTVNNHSNELINKQTQNTVHTGEMSYQASLRNIQPPAVSFSFSLFHLLIFF